MKLLLSLLFCLFVSLSHADPAGTGCWFLRDSKIELPPSIKSIRVQDFLIYGAEAEMVARQEKIFERSSHFLKTELGWKFPFTRKELGRPVLEVYFVSAGADFTGTVRPGPVLILNEKILSSRDFAAHWIHYLAHASELMYRNAGGHRDQWFYEATAGWMEGQFTKASAATRLAQYTRRLRPQIPLDNASPDLALGASQLLDLMSRPYRDVIRQSWEQWSYARDERVMDILDRVLQLNHLPSRNSYVLNYFLRAPLGSLINNSTTSIELQPYSAAVFQGGPDGASSGGAHLSFQPKGAPGAYSASLIYYGSGEKEGILSIKESLRDSWSVIVPYSGLGRYRLVLVNSSDQVVRGTVMKRFDAAIPAVVEYFRANAEEEGGVHLEWKTSRESGVAFWNLYRISNGAKERLNAMPIPASIDSPTGLNYMFVDYTSGAFYSLEAITGEGFPGFVATTATGSNQKDRENDRQD